MNKVAGFKSLFMWVATLCFVGVSASVNGQPLQPENPSGIYPSHGNTVLGMEMLHISAEWGLEYAGQTDARIVRKNGLLWSEVEPSAGQRNWGSQTELDQELLNAAAQNWDVMLVIRATPAWAQADPPWHCGEILDGALPVFGTFVRDAVARYSQPPYSVKYFEIWNEEDVDHRPFFPNETYYQDAGFPFGCQGNFADAYYGGEKFAKVMQAAYPQAKAANPSALVILGGLFYPCKPPDNFNIHDVYCNMSRYLEGVLRAGGGAYFDGVSFHAYDYYCKRDMPPTLGHCENYPNADYANRNWETSSQSLPSVLAAKARQLKIALANYGISDKLMYATEASLICETDAGERCQETAGQRDDAYEVMKAYYTPRMLAAGIAEGLQGVLFYNVHDNCSEDVPFGTSLLNCDNSWQHAAYAFKFGAQKLRNAVYKREITEFAGVAGYEFDRAGRKLWVIWTKDRAAHSIRLPRLPVGMWDAKGNPLPPTPVVSVGQNTLYVEWVR